MLFLYLSALDTPEEKTKLSYYYEKYRLLLGKIAYDYLKSHSLAEDAVHNTFLTILNDKEKIISLSESDFRNWAIMIIKSRCIDILRKNKHYNNSVSLDTDDFPEIISDTLNAEESFIQKEQSDKLQRCFEKLNLQSKTILEMKYVLELSFKEISNELDMTFDQVNGILRRAREKMKSLMENEEL
jgi:RNA polymerase sigma-70 factor (ECF subfamily)